MVRWRGGRSINISLRTQSQRTPNSSEKDEILVLKESGMQDLSIQICRRGHEVLSGKTVEVPPSLNCQHLLLHPNSDEFEAQQTGCPGCICCHDKPATSNLNGPFLSAFPMPKTLVSERTEARTPLSVEALFFPSI